MTTLNRLWIIRQHAYGIYVVDEQHIIRDLHTDDAQWKCTTKAGQYVDLPKGPVSVKPGSVFYERYFSHDDTLSRIGHWFQVTYDDMMYTSYRNEKIAKMEATQNPVLKLLRKLLLPQKVRSYTYTYEKPSYLIPLAQRPYKVLVQCKSCNYIRKLKESAESPISADVSTIYTCYCDNCYSEMRWTGVVVS